MVYTADDFTCIASTPTTMSTAMSIFNDQIFLKKYYFWILWLFYILLLQAWIPGLHVFEPLL